MTQEEAIGEITYLVYSNQETMGSAKLQDALRVITESLRNPLPDPDTGLVPCGCGCKPELRDDGWGWHQVYCTGCDMHGGNSRTPDGVIEEWNTAMGWMVEG